MGSDLICMKCAKPLLLAVSTKTVRTQTRTLRWVVGISQRYVPSLRPNPLETKSLKSLSRNTTYQTAESCFCFFSSTQIQSYNKPAFGNTPPPLYIGWVGVGWRRHCKTCRSIRELDNQGTVFCFFGGRPQLVVELDHCAR